MIRSLITSALLLYSIGMLAQSIDIIPKPVSTVKSNGSFKLPKRINYSCSDKNLADYLNHYFNSVGIESSVSNSSKSILNISIIQPDTLLPEGYYNLVITKKGISVQAPESLGLFYGVQSLIQLITLNNNVLPSVSITDYPRFSWRGLHLDVCRHFFPTDFIKKYIDLMAHYKLNKFHWHLTEDQGWRIEIKKYPKLHEVAAYRNETLIGHYSDKPHKFDGKRYGGFYTQEEIKEIVAYASERHITVIPEIEMPGHSLAALSAYPDLGCTGGPYEAATLWGVFDDVYCAGKEETFTFLQNVLDEVLALFPSTYIHVGGDECPKARWEKCELCQQRIKNEKLKDEHELQSYFIQRIEKYLNSKGRSLIGWDEILEGGLAPNATVMSWRGEAGGIAAAKSDHDVVMSPGFALYFDHYNSKPDGEPIAIGGFTPVRKVYQYDPTPASLTERESKHILGAQANVWTEYIETTKHIEYMVYPRALALAEVVWSPKEKRDWNDFSKRLSKQYALLDLWKVNYRKPKDHDNDIVASLQVTVKNSSGPVENCVVKLLKSANDSNPVTSGTTDKQGRVNFRFIEPFNYFILISKENTNNFTNPVQSGDLKPWETIYKVINLD